jgi:hypothetical protein
MATERTRQIIFGVVVVVLGLVLYRAWTVSTGSVAPSTASNPRARTTARAADAPATAPDVHLRALEKERPKPAAGERNLFRFKPKPVPPPPVVKSAPVAQPSPSLPPGPPPPPPIQLKFIGIVESTASAKKIAALVDPTGRAYQGSEGDVVAGQYRILRIGVESVEVAYLDGRGRQMIRLSGS